MKEVRTFLTITVNTAFVGAWAALGYLLIVPQLLPTFGMRVQDLVDAAPVAFLGGAAGGMLVGAAVGLMLAAALHDYDNMPTGRHRESVERLALQTSSILAAIYAVGFTIFARADLLTILLYFLLPALIGVVGVNFVTRSYLRREEFRSAGQRKRKRKNEERLQVGSRSFAHLQDRAVQPILKPEQADQAEQIRTR